MMIGNRFNQKVRSYFEIPEEQRKKVILPEEDVFTCHISLPIMPDKELAEAVHWELPLHIPYAEGTYYYDYLILSKVDGMQDVQAFVVLKEVIDELDAEAKEQGLVLTTVSVAGYEGRLNLLPDGRKRRRAPLTKLYKLGAVLALGLGACLLVGSCVYREVQRDKLEESKNRIVSLRDWQERYELYTSREKRIKALENRLKHIEKERVPWSEVLLSLGDSTPENCWLTHIKQNESSKVIEVQGKAVAMEQVQSLVKNLTVSEMFASVKLAATYAVKDELLGYKLLLNRKEGDK